jgi:hypothetical protein
MTMRQNWDHEQADSRTARCPSTRTGHHAAMRAEHAPSDSICDIFATPVCGGYRLNGCNPKGGYSSIWIPIVHSRGKCEHGPDRSRILFASSCPSNHPGVPYLSRWPIPTALRSQCAKLTVRRYEFRSRFRSISWTGARFWPAALSMR